MGRAFAGPRLPSSNRQTSSNDRGYILYLVLIVIAVAGILFSISLNNTASVRVLAAHEMQRLQARLLSESGIARAEYFLNGGDAHDLFWETDKYEETVDEGRTITMQCARFGAFAKVTSTGAFRAFTHVGKGIAGREPPDTLAPVLTLSGTIRGLVLDAGSRIQGTVVLDNGPVVSGAGMSRIAGAEKWVKNRVSPALPLDPKPLDDQIEAMSKAVASVKTDSAMIFGSLTLSHLNDTLLKRNPLTVRGDCTIDDISIIDKAVCISGKLTLGNKAACRMSSFWAAEVMIAGGKSEKCLFYADSTLRITGGTHNSQFFSQDSIVVAKDATFGRMALLVSRRTSQKDTVMHGGIAFAEKGVYTGCAICYSDSAARTPRLRTSCAISFGPHCVFSGCLVTDGNIEVADIVIDGHIWAQSITGVQGQRKVLHRLFGALIRKPDQEAVFPLIGPLPVRVCFEEDR